MYLQGKLTIDLTDTHIDMRPPRNFFGALANLLTAHSRCRIPPHLGADLGTMPRDTPRGVRL